MASTIRPAEFTQAINDILGDYSHDVREVVDKSITTVAREAQKELKSAGTFKGTVYKKSWAVRIEKKRIYTTATIYNRKPGLTHLLEFGHIKQNGGRTREFPHIAPVNEEIQSEVIKKIEENLNDI